MAKRKRLSPADPTLPQPGLSAVDIPIPRPRTAAPIADVAGDVSARAALDTLADEVAAARAEGRMIQSLPLGAVASDHLIRDRIAVDEEEMAALVESLRARGQQSPVEVVALGSGRYGLISGWRRLTALTRLHAETGEARFGQVAALVRTPASAADAYLSMVEENEIRAGISFYERARLAAEAVRLGVHPDIPTAIVGLYARASASRRSKIASFVAVHERLGPHLRFGSAIPERLGLALAAALQAEPGFGPRLCDALRKREAGTAAEERDTLERALRKSAGSASIRKPRGEELAPGLFLETGSGRAILSGPALDDAMMAGLRDWVSGRS